MSYYSERRADRAAAAEQVRADRAQAAQLRRADRQADEDRRRDRAQWRARRRHAAVAGLTGWLGGHVQDALFGVIIVVPAVLAWSAMARFGANLYGPLGVTLPLFSEASMWVFAAATTRAVRESRPALGLRAGLWLAAGVAATLNYLDGAQTSVRDGVVMAIVSVGGLIVHQLVTAAPRARRPDRFTHQATHRAAVMRRAVLATTVGEVDAQGQVRLVVTPGRITLRRQGVTRRWVAVPAPAAVVPDPVDQPPGGGVAAWVEDIDAQVAVWAREPAEPAGPAPTRPTGTSTDPSGHPDPAVGPELAGWLARARAEITAGRLPARPSKRDVARVLHVRATTAARIARVLKADPDDNPGDPGAGHLARL